MSRFGDDLDFGEKAFALIAGISTFQDAAYAKKPLPQTVHDAQDLALLLQRRLGWKGDNIITLTGGVRKDDLRTAFMTLRTRIADLPTADLFLFFLSTHGHPYKKPSAGDETVFLATDTILSDPFRLADTGLTRHILGVYIDAIPARQKVIISDACFSASALSADEIVPPQAYAGIDAAVLSSSVGKSYALAQRNSVFTECLLKVLSNSTGEIGVGGLADAISRTLPEGWPAPFLDTRGRYIVLGVVGEAVVTPQAINFEQLLLFGRSQLQLVLTRYRNEATQPGYVPRKNVESKFENYLSNSNGKTFSIVGAAGVGKSTLLMHLAEEANDQGFAVLWFSAMHFSANITIESLIVTAVSALNKTATMTELENVLADQPPLLIFIDAINEWSGDTTTLQTLIADLEKLSASRNFRVIFTCREEIWLRINQTRRQAEIPELEASAQLDVFDEVEFAAAIQIYQVPGMSFGALNRQPLFLKMASAVFRDSSTPIGNFVDLFASYVEAKTSRVDMRLDLVRGQTLSRAEQVATTLSQNNAESIEVDQFLAIVSEPLAVALFDEGLFRRVGESVSFETEMLYEYVLSRTLPPDPFANVSDISTLIDEKHNGAWWRAAAFRLWRMTDVERLRNILTLLTSEASPYGWRVGYVMRLGMRWKDITAFRDQYLKAFALAGRFPPDEAFILLSQTLQKKTRESLEFVMDAVRLLFLEDWQYDWRPKKWDSLDVNGLRRPFMNSSEDQNRPAYSLYECFVTSPGQTFYVLVSQWLNDRTTLEDDEAKICHVAAMFLMAFAPDATQEFQQAVTDSLRNEIEFLHEGGMWLHRVVAWVVKHRPYEFVHAASEWTAESSQNFQTLGLEVIRNLPEELAGEALEIVKRYLAREDLPLIMANQAIASTGNIPSRKVLHFLFPYSELAEHQSAVADACKLLFPAFPNDVTKLINHLAAQPLIRSDAREAILNFYRSQLTATAKDAVQFFRTSIEAEPGKHNRDISYSIELLQKPDPYITEFVEERLKAETGGYSLEQYTYYLKNVRLLSVDDVPWLERWINSGSPTYAMLGYVAASPLPLPAKLQVLTLLDQRDPNFVEHCVNSIFRDSEEQAVTKFAVEVCNSSTYASLSARAQRWFALMAGGKSTHEAEAVIKLEARKALFEEE